MALDDVIRQLVEVRAKIQTAIALTASVEDKLRDSRAQAGEVLGGTNNPTAQDGLGLYDAAARDAEEILKDLTEADDQIAKYIDFLDPGHASGTRNTDIARPTGEEIVNQASETSSRSRNLLQRFTTKAGDVEDAIKDTSKHVHNYQIMNDDFRPPTDTMTSTQVPTDHPVISRPGTPQADVASAAMGFFTAGLVVAVGANKAVEVSKKAINRWRGNE